MEELGSGFYLAMHDLEIRGAGEVLGENQSGNMMEVGFQLYNDMLAEAVRSLKAGREPDLLAPLSAATEINLHAPALLPDAYCGDVHMRLSLYKRLASASKRRADRRPARGDHRPLRQAAAAGPGAVRRAPPARAGQDPTASPRSTPAPAVTTISFAPNPPIDAGAASSSWCRRTATSSSPATTSCASRSARTADGAPNASASFATCCARWARRRSSRPHERGAARAVNAKSRRGWSFAASRRRCASPTSS